MRSSHPRLAWCQLHSRSGPECKVLGGGGRSQSGSCISRPLTPEGMNCSLPCQASRTVLRAGGRGWELFVIPFPQELCFPWRPSPHTHPGSTGRVCVCAHVCRGVHSILSRLSCVLGGGGTACPSQSTMPAWLLSCSASVTFETGFPPSFLS